MSSTPAERSSSGRSLALALALVAASLGACDDDEPKPRTHPGFGDESAPPDRPLSAATLTFVKRATAAATHLKPTLDDEPDRTRYLALRRAVAAARPFFSLRAQMGSEVLVGPQRSLNEGGGALGLLDAALARGDRDAAKEQLVQVIRALRLIDHEISLNEVPPDDAVEALSDAAFRLGLQLTEAYAGVPDGPDAVLADIRGTIAGIEAIADTAYQTVAAAKGEQAAAAHQALVSALSPLKKAAASVDHAHALSGRAGLVLQTGALGVAARRFADTLGLPVELPYRARRPVNDNGIDEPIHALVVPAPRVDPRPGDREAMAALGSKLFTDARLSKNRARACDDCHQPAQAFGGDEPTPDSLDPHSEVKRNTPPLLYTSLHAAQLWDGRFASAERQAQRVLHAPAEMGLERGSLEKIVEGVPAYAEAFAEAFPDGVTEDNVARALVAFEIDAFVPADSPLDRFARGRRDALDDRMQSGFDLFVGKGRCARCHVPPMFGGSRPPDFSIAVYAALGVPVSPDTERLDPDPGRGAVTERSIDAHAFKTPTVRNAAFTAPYFHHGGFPALADVLDFYVDGGGRGMGLEVPNQDPEVRELELDEDEKKQLLHFMNEALADPPSTREPR